MVLGETGVGKSALVDALSTRWIARSENFLLLGENEGAPRMSATRTSMGIGTPVKKSQGSVDISYWSLPEEKGTRRVIQELKSTLLIRKRGEKCFCLAENKKQQIQY